MGYTIYPAYPMNKREGKMDNVHFIGRQFKYLAKSLRDSKPESHTREYEQWEKTVRTIAHDLALTNDNFNRAAFFRVAGLNKGG